MVVVALRSHCVRAGTALPPPSTPSSLLLFGAELPAGSLAPSTHGSDLGEATEEVVGTLIANSSLLAAGLEWDPAPLHPPPAPSLAWDAK